MPGRDIIALLTPLDLEAIRIPLERRIDAQLCAQDPYLWQQQAVLDDARRRARGELDDHLGPRLDTPHYQRLLGEVCAALGIENVYDLHVEYGEIANASAFLGTNIIGLSEGLLGLDNHALRYALGHEIGHHLFHGRLERLSPVVVESLADRCDERARKWELEVIARGLRHAQELTADRLGLLASQNLAGALRLKLTRLAGKHVMKLRDPKSFLHDAVFAMRQARHSGERPEGSDTHPDGRLRMFGLWRFSQTAEYRELTGLGAGRHSLAAVDRELADLLPEVALREGDRSVEHVDALEPVCNPAPPSPAPAEPEPEPEPEERTGGLVDAALRFFRADPEPSEIKDDIDIDELLEDDDLNRRFADLEARQRTKRS